jgi:O-acetyl-ADP-ribose deacetylase (regulator of RNase III)
MHNVLHSVPHGYGKARRSILDAMEIKPVWADITTVDVDAIVNAANPALTGGGGVDGAIHRAAGPRLLLACQALPQVHDHVRCPTGEARITPGFDLKARWVIHTVGPVWRGGHDGEKELLAACYRNSLRLARTCGVRDIAFPAISCGVYGYPAQAAARIAVESLRKEAGAGPDPRHVLLCSVGQDVHDALADALTA